MKQRPKRNIRRTGFRPQRRVIRVLAEGEVTEPAYLRSMASESVRLDFGRTGGFVPLSLVTKARQEVKANRRARDSEFDEIWCVFDRDEHPNVARPARSGYAVPATPDSPGSVDLPQPPPPISHGNVRRFRTLPMAVRWHRRTRSPATIPRTAAGAGQTGSTRKRIEPVVWRNRDGGCMVESIPEPPSASRPTAAVGDPAKAGRPTVNGSSTQEIRQWAQN